MRSNVPGLEPVAGHPFVGDVEAIARLQTLPDILKVACQVSGLGFAAIAKLTDFEWTACAVRDDIGRGVRVGDSLPLDSTLCSEARAGRRTLVVDHATEDPLYRDHAATRSGGIESCISVPIVLDDGTCFGTLSAVGREPANVSAPHVVAMFELFASLVAQHLGTERRQRIEALHWVEAVELREQLIAVLGHDLRNPLAAVSAAGHALGTGVGPDLAVRLGGLIAGSARRMSGLIEEVVDMARGRQAGGFDIESAPVGDLAEALFGVVEELRSAHPTRAIVGCIDLPPVVVCDRGRVLQMMSNLLGNAISHGAADRPVSLSVSAGADGIRLVVRNDGPAIPAEHLPHLFSPFWRGPSSSPRRGLGLGLYICAQIARAHGGTLEVESSAESGTAFSALLPRHLGDATGPHEARGGRGKILLDGLDGGAVARVAPLQVL